MNTNKIYPEKNDFVKLSKEYNLIPVYTELKGDLYTTISLFIKIRRGKYQFLLESAVNGEFMGRYSFMGYSDRAIICKDNRIFIDEKNKKIDKGKFDNPLEYIRDYSNKIEAYSDKNLPPFVNGLVGYLGYDTIQYFEKIDLHKNDTLKQNDFELIIADRVIIYDSLTHKLFIVHSAEIDENQNIDDIYNNSIEEINSMTKEIIENKVELKPLSITRQNGKVQYKSNFSKKRYEESVEKAKEYIRAGDIFQLVLSQRLKVELKGDAFNLYRNLRIINPSPYMFYLKCDSTEIIGSSPEIHVQLQDGEVRVRPIAGTRPRGKNIEEDIINEKDLLSDEKELAEHIMLVDLGRNDVGRVCKGGTVKVDDFKMVEHYSHVMHIVSNVTGQLSGDHDTFDLIKATFPAGTVSGAPKIRAMEIINELEPERRGIYSGMIGYFTFDNNFDSCITIRTIVVKDDIAYLQAGAGIVADSIPEKEYYETIHKLRALTKAIEITGE